MSIEETLEHSNRGFKRFPSVPSHYGGSTAVYESSSAMHPRIWISVTEPVDLNAYARGEEVEMKEAMNHLNIEDAETLRDQLTYLIDNHYHKS